MIDSAGLYGAERILVYLMEAQAVQGIQAGLVSLGSDREGVKEIEREAEARGLDVFRVRSSISGAPQAAAKILRHAREWGADILHSHGYKGDILLGLLSPRVRRAPVVTTIHGWTAVGFFSKVGLYQAAAALAMRRMDRVVAVSSGIRDYPLLRRLGIRPAVIQNGIPALTFSDAGSERRIPDPWATRPERFRVVSIGRLSPEKGFDVLIRAVSLMKEQGVDACLVILGEGPERESLSKLSEKLGVSDRVLLAGYEDRAYRFLPSFDVFALPSRTEGLPVTLLEAMQAGVPIVATRVGEIPEVLDQGGLGELADPGDAEGLARALTAVHGNRDLALEKSRLARDKALSAYSSDRMAQGYLHLYASLLRERTRSTIGSQGHPPR